MQRSASQRSAAHSKIVFLRAIEACAHQVSPAGSCIALDVHPLSCCLRAAAQASPLDAAGTGLGTVAPPADDNIIGAQQSEGEGEGAAAHSDASTAASSAHVGNATVDDGSRSWAGTDLDKPVEPGQGTVGPRPRLPTVHRVEVPTAANTTTAVPPSADSGSSAPTGGEQFKPNASAPSDTSGDASAAHEGDGSGDGGAGSGSWAGTDFDKPVEPDHGACPNHPPAPRTTRCHPGDKLTDCRVFGFVFAVHCNHER